MTQAILEQILKETVDHLPIWAIHTTYDGRVSDTFGNQLPKLAQGSRILDWGCSRGKTTKDLSVYYTGSTVTGIDIDPGVISEAKEKNPDLDFRVADGYTFTGKPFDLVVCMNNLAIGLDPRHPDEVYREALSRITRLVKVGGYLAFSAINNYLVLRRNQDSFSLEESSVHVSTSTSENINANPLCRISRMLTGLTPDISIVQINKTKLNSPDYDNLSKMIISRTNFIDFSTKTDSKDTREKIRYFPEEDPLNFSSEKIFLKQIPYKLENKPIYRSQFEFPLQMPFYPNHYPKKSDKPVSGETQ